MPTNEIEKLQIIVNALEVMQDLQPNISIQGMLTFFTVRALEFEEGEASVKQLSKRLDTTSSHAAKLVKSHTATTRYGIAGSQLLKTMENPQNRQSTLVQMTVKGRNALSKTIGPNE